MYNQVYDLTKMNFQNVPNKLPQFYEVILKQLTKHYYTASLKNQVRGFKLGLEWRLRNYDKIVLIKNFNFVGAINLTKISSF